MSDCSCATVNSFSLVGTFESFCPFAACATTGMRRNTAKKASRRLRIVIYPRNEPAGVAGPARNF
jgi:hypothetical protein